MRRLLHGKAHCTSQALLLSYDVCAVLALAGDPARHRDPLCKLLHTLLPTCCLSDRMQPCLRLAAYSYTLPKRSWYGVNCGSHQEYEGLGLSLFCTYDRSSGSKKCQETVRVCVIQSTIIAPPHHAT